MNKIQRLFDKYGVVHTIGGECINKHHVKHAYFDPNDYSGSYLYVIDTWFPLMTQDQHNNFCDMAARYAGTRYVMIKIGKVCPINPLTILMEGI